MSGASRMRGSGAALACLVATACGSTVGITSAGSTSADGSGLGIPRTSSGIGANTAGVAGVDAPTGTSVTGGVTTDPGSVTSGGTAGSDGTINPGATASTVATGLSPATFKIGMQYSSNANAAMGSIGGGTFNDDRRKENDAVIAWINKHGGVAGRPASPIYNNIDATANPQTQSESACAQWTQDNHVSVAIPRSAVADNDLLRECLKKATTPGILGNTFSRTLTSSFASSPLWFETMPLSLNAYARTYVRGLADQGFFKGAKVGVVYYDKASFPAALKSDLLPALKAVGVTNPSTFGASIDGASTLASGSQEMSAAVLQFRSQGVNRVIFFEPWVGYFVFLNTARSQGYSPTYGLSSQEGPQLAMDLGLVSPDQLKDARLVSWSPITDLKGYQPYMGPRLKLCTQIYRAAGITIASDQTSFAGQMGDCETLLVIQDAFTNAPKKLVPQSFRTGMEALGTAMQLALRPSGSLGVNKHWGVSKYWVGHFDASRKGFVYDGSARPVS